MKVKVEKWANFYSDGMGCAFYDSREEADINAVAWRVDCRKVTIEWEEPEKK